VTERSDPNSAELRHTLTALETELVLHAPQIAQALLPGLTSDGFQAAVIDFPYQIPAAARQLYQWHDGTQLLNGRDRAALFPGGKMLPLREAVRQWAGAIEGDRRAGRSVWQRDWLPMFTDDWGGWHVIKCAGGSHPILAFNLVELPRIDSTYPDLRRMFESVIRRWRSGAFRQGELGTVEADARAVAAVYRAEDGELPDLTRILKDLNEGPEQTYIDALGLLRTRLYPEAFPGLMGLLETGSVRGRRAASELLGAIGPREAATALRRAADADPDDVVRLLAKKSLSELDTGS